MALLPLGLVGAAVFLGPFVAPYDPQRIVAKPLQPPSIAHLFGTDDLGRDLFSRVLFGARATGTATVIIVFSGVVIGGLVGLIAGASGGTLDYVLMRLTDLFLVLPSVILAIAVVAALGPGLRNTVIALMIFWWPWYARLVRGEVRALATRPYVEAARLSGVGSARVLRRHLLPGVLPTIVVTATFDAALAIITLAGLSFLGLGNPPPAPELGAMVAQQLPQLTVFWWLPVFPALAIFLLALPLNLAGDSLRDLMGRA